MQENISDLGFFRLPQIIGDQEANPPIEPIIPISKSSWWSGISAGRYPAGVKIAPRTTAWRRSDIIELCARLKQGGK